MNNKLMHFSIKYTLICLRIEIIENKISIDMVFFLFFNIKTEL